jgi:hypothetical protein
MSGKLLAVHSGDGESAAIYLSQLINDDPKLEIGLVEFDEKHWNDNRYAAQGEISEPTLIIGDIRKTTPIWRVATIKFNQYGVKYAVSGRYAIVKAEPRLLLNSECEYKKFVEELNILVPDRRFEDCTHGKKKLKEVFLHGLRRYYAEKESVVAQQLLYGTVHFFKKELPGFAEVKANDNLGFLS